MAFAMDAPVNSAPNITFGEATYRLTKAISLNGAAEEQMAMAKAVSEGLDYAQIEA